MEKKQINNQGLYQTPGRLFFLNITFNSITNEALVNKVPIIVVRDQSMYVEMLLTCQHCMRHVRPICIQCPL